MRIVRPGLKDGIQNAMSFFLEKVVMPSMYSALRMTRKEYFGYHIPIKGVLMT